METVVKVNSSRQGRDKVFRTLQYCLKAINSRPYLATNETRNLEKTLASFRKLLRLGTFIDVLHGARQSMHHPSLLTGAIVTLSKIANAMYLLGDHLIWIHRSVFLHYGAQNDEKQNFTTKTFFVIFYVAAQTCNCLKIINIHFVFSCNC